MIKYGLLFLVAAAVVGVWGKVQVTSYTCFSYTVVDEHQNYAEIRCNSTDVFSPEHNECIQPDVNKWPCDQEISCQNKTDHLRFADHEGKCKTYYTCVSGIFYGHNYCPGVLVFNEDHQYCDWSYNVKPPCGTYTAVIG